jgi:monovalent cation:H+ antiporter, CPA1 family
MSMTGLTVAGGIAVGIVCEGAAIGLAGRTSEHLVEAALTTVAAYGPILLAENLHASWVFATVTAGLLMGNLGILRADDRNLLGVVVFSIVIQGLTMPRLLRHLGFLPKKI